MVKLWLIVGGGGELMPSRGWLWVVAAKLWLVVGGREWSRMVVASYGWSWVVARFSNAHSQVNYYIITKVSAVIKVLYLL